MHSIKKPQWKTHSTHTVRVDDILILSCDKATCHWVREILTSKYEKVTHNKGDKLCYLGMTLRKRNNGYEILMKPYIEEILAFYSGRIKESVNPAKVKSFHGKQGVRETKSEGQS